MRLYGTLTSPYVRRVRVVALELGVPFTFVQTSSPEGQAELRTLTPIWKVPIAEIDRELVYDSRSIVELLVERHGWGALEPAPAHARREESNRLHVIDAALDSGIRVFYMKEADPERVPYLAKERERIASCLGWLEGRMAGGSFRATGGFGLSELALYSALDWMRFRAAYPVERHPGFMVFLDKHAERPSLAETVPPRT